MDEHEEPMIGDGEPTIGDDDASELDETGRNLTQRRLDEEDGSVPVDLPWEDEPAAEETDEEEAEEQGAW